MSLDPVLLDVALYLINKQVNRILRVGAKVASTPEGKRKVEDAAQKERGLLIRENKVFASLPPLKVTFSHESPIIRWQPPLPGAM